MRGDPAGGGERDRGGRAGRRDRVASTTGGGDKNGSDGEPHVRELATQPPTAPADNHATMSHPGNVQRSTP